MKRTTAATTTSPRGFPAVCSKILLVLISVLAVALMTPPQTPSSFCGIQVVEAAKSGNNNNGNSLNNFRVVLDSAPGNSKNTRVMLKNRITGKNPLSPLAVSSDDVKAFVEQAKKELHEVAVKTKELSRNAVYKFKENLQHYSNLEIGFYAALTVALTVTLKTVVFSNGSSKTLDMNKLSYILNYAQVTYRPVPEARVQQSRRKRTLPSIMVTPSIGSSDGKTFTEKLLRQSQRRPSSSSPPPSSRPAQVVVDTVSSFYQEDPLADSGSPSSHNAVVDNMSPAMRRTLKARRIRVRGGAGTNGIMERLEIGLYFTLWYALNVIYNIVNKKVLNVLPAPLTVGTAQFGIGALYCCLVWLFRVRPLPTLTPAGKSGVAKVGVYHALGQLATMVSVGAGTVSFTHIVKAMEPFFSAIVSGLYFGQWMPPQVYATLIPVVCGVGYACLKELSFSWLAFGSAMASNVFFALRAVMSKIALQSGKAAGTNLTPPNMFGLVTVAAFIVSIPLALIGEGQEFGGLWSAALEQVENKSHFIRAIVLSGLFHYLNNEVMYLALGKVHPVTLAVGNTMKRVFILVSSVMVFRNPISVQAGIGSTVGIAGVLLYSLTKQYYESLPPPKPTKQISQSKRFRKA
eukprot:CAMPEP_0113497468 /NCGR_PEP_ID=MMETSP0014_2-20120614/30649_1 /TAXON_ID=2857 /ORGANISM="Nitzschia sp." /LENGTH=629 /DNA_ID=CAMNT_0000391415 /DNA_START=103 /DNA_END=1992 /DNA_ORIENTATION=- /assembly_acc=CAM_ASM_000159